MIEHLDMQDKESKEEGILRTGGEITLINFKLEPREITVVKKIAGSYVRKLREAANYKEVKLRLKKHQHGKSFLYEVEAEAIMTSGKKRDEKSEEGKNIVLNANSTDYNLYSALADVLEKISSQAGHKSRTTKERGLEIKKSQED